MKLAKFLKSLPKDKLQKLILTVIVCLTALGGVINFYVLKKLDEFSLKGQEVRNLTQKLQAVQEEMKLEVSNTKIREQIRDFLTAQEQRMVDGDSFSWIVREISLLAEKHPVRVAALSPGTRSALVSKPQYEGYSTRLEVSGKYDDLGRFISDLENKFPTGTIHNLTMAVADASRGECRINFEVTLLVRRTVSHNQPPAEPTETGKKKTA